MKRKKIHAYAVGVHFSDLMKKNGKIPFFFYSCKETAQKIVDMRLGLKMFPVEIVIKPKRKKR